MNTDRFTDEKTGKLVKAPQLEGKWAFLPDSLPPDWEFPLTLWPLLSEAKMLLGTLNGIGRQLANPLLLLKPLQQREALRSSSLEGTFASPEELLMFDLQIQKSANKTNIEDWKEVWNYGEALRLGQAYVGEYSFSLNLIRQLHQWLLQGVRGREKSLGQFRDCQVFIGSDQRFIPPPAHLLQDCLENLESQFVSTGNFDPLVHAYLMHYQFESIHPFEDGNGRVGRLLLALMTSEAFGHVQPWLYMSAYYEKYKDEYIDLLFGVSAKGRWEEWIKFCLNGTIVQANDSIDRCDLLIETQRVFRARVSEGSARLHPIIDDLFTRPMLTIPELEKRFGVTYPTAKADVDRLTTAGVLVHMQGTTHPKTFYSPRIFAIAYNEDLGQIPE